MGSAQRPYQQLSTQAVLDLRDRDRTGRAAPRLVLRPESGAPGVGTDPGPAGDHALRCDVLLALLGRLPAGPVVGLLTRPGEPEWHREDAGWDAAMTAALREAGRRGRLIVVTRAGWAEPRTGVVRRQPRHPGVRDRG
jgi:hypothetical protein